MPTGYTFSMLVAAAVATAALPSAGAAADVHGSAADRFSALERDAWRYYKAKDEAALRRLAPADFADLYLDGTVVDRERWLKDMHDVEVPGSELKNFHVFQLNPGTYVVTYEARARGRTSTLVVETHVGVTSAWARRGGAWANVFYEENALEPVRRIPISRPSAAPSPRRR